MIFNQTIMSDVKIERLEDLKKLKLLMDETNIKINISNLAKELGKDRRTIKKYIQGYKKSKTRKRSSYLDKYYSIIKKLLESKQIFFYKRNLWQYLKDNHDLECPETTFKSYLARNSEFNDYFKNKKRRNVANKSLMRFETAVGQQAQLDWKESLTLELSNGEMITINIFVLILSYSRFRVYKISISKTQDILFNFIDEAFECFGGVPTEVLTDNMKTVMDVPRTMYSKGKVNNKFQQFADDYGFKVKPCIAGRPNTKAKVESPMKLLDELFAYNGILTFQGLNEKVVDLNNRINYKVHTTTGKIPILHLDKEKDFLISLPQKRIRSPYKIKTTHVKVNPQSLISYKGNLYSVPPKHINKKVSLQVYDNKIHIYFNTNLIALHEISCKKMNYSLKDYKAITELSLNKRYVDINLIAEQNLKNIGELYSD